MTPRPARGAPRGQRDLDHGQPPHPARDPVVRAPDDRQRRRRPALVGFFSLLPFVISSALGGVIVDRLGYRRASIVTDLASGSSVLADPDPLPHRRAAAGRAARARLRRRAPRRARPDGARGDPPRARRACRDDARARHEPLRRRLAGANMLGAPLAGVLIAVIGPANVLVLDAATFAVSALLMRSSCLRRSRRTRRPTPSGTSPSSGRATRSSGGRRSSARSWSWCSSRTRSTPAMGGVLMPVYADRVLDSVVALGLMSGAMGVTAFVGTLVFAWIGHRLPRVADPRRRVHARRAVALLPPRRDAGRRAGDRRLRDRRDRDRADQPDPRHARVRARPAASCGHASSAPSARA